MLSVISSKVANWVEMSADLFGSCETKKLSAPKPIDAEIISGNDL